MFFRIKFLFLAKKTTESSVFVLWHPNTLLCASPFSIPLKIPSTSGYFSPYWAHCIRHHSRNNFLWRKTCAINSNSGSISCGGFWMGSHQRTKHLFYWALVSAPGRRFQLNTRKNFPAVRTAERYSELSLKEPVSHQLDMGSHWEKILYREFKHPRRSWSSYTQGPANPRSFWVYKRAEEFTKK